MEKYIININVVLGESLSVCSMRKKCRSCGMDVTTYGFLVEGEKVCLKCLRMWEHVQARKAKMAFSRNQGT